MTVALAYRRRVLDELSRVATGDVVKLWRGASGLGSGEFRAIIEAGFPEIVTPYSSAAGELAADWYDQSAPELKYRATVGDLPDEAALRSSAQWALGANGDAALVRLAGTLQRAIWMTNRDTLVGNVRAEKGAAWARSVSADSCAFCALLATRGAAYLSAETGSFKAHDHCRCQAVEIRPGKYWEPPSYIEKYEQAYKDAAKGESDPKVILAAMRQTLGSH